MSPAGLMVSVALAFAGLSALALSLDRHHRAAFRRSVTQGRAAQLRGAGFAGIGLSVAAAVALAALPLAAAFLPFALAAR